MEWLSNQTQRSELDDQTQDLRLEISDSEYQDYPSKFRITVQEHAAHRIAEWWTQEFTIQLFHLKQTTRSAMLRR